MNVPLTPGHRVRHELRFRLLEVLRVERPTPLVRRIVLGGAALEGFASLGHDDHVKLFFPAPGQDVPVLPTPGPNGPVFPPGERPAARDYTPRRFSETELEIDFVLHGHGPAATWAAQAAPGQQLGVGGPRGSFVPPEGLDWVLLAGDETALPAIARRVAELPAATRAIVLAEVADAAEQQPLPGAEVRWLHRNGAPPGDPALLSAAVAALALPPGEGFAWVAAESEVAKALRALLLEQHGMAKDRIKAAGYWKRGAVASHETLND